MKTIRISDQPMQMLADVFYDLFQNFSTKGKEFTESFLEDNSLLDCIEQDWLYLQGYKDCIKLLKLIEAI